MVKESRDHSTRSLDLDLDNNCYLLRFLSDGYFGNGARDIHLFFNQEDYSWSLFVLHSALPARPQHLVSSLLLVEV